MQNPRSLLIASLLLVAFLFSCQEEVAYYSPRLVASLDGKSYTLDSGEALYDFIGSSLGDMEATILNATMEDGNDKDGHYYLIRADLKQENGMGKLAIVLRETGDKTAGQINLQTSCTMSCTPHNWCEPCRMTVISPCETIECGCEQGTGGCTSSVTFGDEK